MVEIKDREDKLINLQEELTDGTLLYGWKSKSPLTPVAPSYVHYITDKKIFSEEECESWYRYLLEQEPVLLDKFRVSSGHGGTGSSENSITARFSYFNVLKFDFHLVPKLKTAICNGIKTILSVSDDTNWQETVYAKSWFNVLRKDEGMNVHSHGCHKNSLYGFHLTIGAKEIRKVSFCDNHENERSYLRLFVIH
jgi:hypothetical protein